MAKKAIPISKSTEAFNVYLAMLENVDNYLLFARVNFTCTGQHCKFRKSGFVAGNTCWSRTRKCYSTKNWTRYREISPNDRFLRGRIYGHRIRKASRIYPIAYRMQLRSYRSKLIRLFNMRSKCARRYFNCSNFFVFRQAIRQRQIV